MEFDKHKVDLTRKNIKRLFICRNVDEGILFTYTPPLTDFWCFEGGL
eukprot:UN19471